jgi:ABC-2 type transport system permease protein
MPSKLYAIAKNTFIEAIRQPVYAVIILISLILLILSPSITMYSIDDDNKLLREICLSTLFLSGLFIAIFSSAGSIAGELESKTAATLLCKPVPRAVFVTGKFIGVSFAVLLAHFLCTITMLMVMRHGVMQTASDEMDLTVILVGAVALITAFVAGGFFNFSWDWNFSASTIITGTLVASTGMIFLALFDNQWQFNPAANQFAIFDVYSSLLLLLAIIVIVALAIMFSTRFNVVITLSFCVGIFLLGLISDYVFGRFADTYLWAKFARAAVPNLQVFWISDAIYQDSPVPLSYIARSSLYAVCYCLGILSLATALFQTREVS